MLQYRPDNWRKAVARQLVLDVCDNGILPYSIMKREAVRLE